MRQEQHVVQLVSAGGVVYRIRDDEIEVVVCGRGSPQIWGLPKGTPEPGETREETAVREVAEETGLEVVAHELIDIIEYWFAPPEDKVRYQKTVLFYLMSATGGDVSLHDHEFDTVRWVPAKEAVNTLTYENEVRIVQKSLAMVSKNARIG